MAKLSNNIEYQNIHLPVANAEYLIRNGFACMKLSSDTLQFIKENICLRIKNDSLDLFRHFPEEEYDKFKFQQSHIGISQLDRFGWIMLLDIMKVQKANHRSYLQTV
jgi:hypothetical protein